MQVVSEEKDHRYRHHEYQSEDDDDAVVMVNEILKHDPVRRLINLIRSLVQKCGLEESLLHHLREQHRTGDIGTVRQEDGMEKQKAEEVLVIVRSDALIQPNAMMIKPRNTLITKSTVLRAGDFPHSTSLTGKTFHKDSSVIGVSSIVLLFSVLSDLPRSSGASQVEEVLAEHNSSENHRLVVVRNEESGKQRLSKQQPEGICPIDDPDVQELQQWVSLVEHIVTSPTKRLISRVS